MIKEKINYILSQRDMSKTSPLSIDLEDEIYNELVAQAKEVDVTPEDLLYCILINYMMEEKKKQLIVENKYERGEDIIDMFDMYSVEKLIETGKTYIIATFNEPVVMMPISSKYKIERCTEKG